MEEKSIKVCTAQDVRAGMELPEAVDGTLSIREVQVSDGEELLGIYAPYVTNTAISFEYEVPALEEFKERIKRIQKGYPYLVAVHEGKIVGYAYASPFKERKAYDFSVETTIYMDSRLRRNGFGSRLYEALEDRLKAQGILNMNACISCTDREDGHLTNASIYFHEHMGFQMVGRFHKCGYKFNTWYDMVWMEKLIGEHNAYGKTL